MLPADLAEALSQADSALRDAIDLRYFPEVGSTNDEVLARAEAGARDGLAVLADAQRAGRGRRGRSWFSPPGAGMYLSTLVRGAEGSTLALLTLAAGVAAAQAVRSVTGLPIELKWPNDLVIGRPWRKLAGILCESVPSTSLRAGGQVDAVVIGIGINLRAAAYPPELRDRATSIETELGRPIDRAPIVVACLQNLRDRVGQLRAGDGNEVLRAWREIGAVGLDRKPVSWQDQGAERRGRARGIDRDGALLVDTERGVERIIAGEVTWDRTI
jgi:BirA family biotin operon repressor/biotin-[acetyl-CoA-carboxylase] ligase